jgi:hypothetical protein
MHICTAKRLIPPLFSQYLDNLRQTHVGDYLIKQFVAPHVAELGNQFKLRGKG